MSYIPGVNLDAAWGYLSTQERDTIFADIAQFITALRNLPRRAQGIISSAYENPAYY